MRSSRVQKTYLHLLEPFAWYADLSCRFGSWNAPRKVPKTANLAIFYTFLRAPITSALAARMICSRVQTPYLHVLATFVWHADLSSRSGSWNSLQKCSKMAFWTLFAPSLGNISACRAPDLILKVHRGANSMFAPFWLVVAEYIQSETEYSPFLLQKMLSIGFKILSVGRCRFAGTGWI